MSKSKGPAYSELYKTVSGVMLFQICLSGLAFMIGPKYILVSFLEVAVSLILSLLFIYLNTSHKRAIFAHLVVALVCGNIVLTLTRLGIYDISQAFLVNWALALVAVTFLFTLNWFVSYQFYTNQLPNLTDFQKTSQRLNRRMFWNMSRRLYFRYSLLRKSSLDWSAIARIALPLGPIIGALLYYNTSKETSPIVLGCLYLTLALIMVTIMGMHSAIIGKLIEFEKQLANRIVLDWS
jgi:hypothetical protein